MKSQRYSIGLPHSQQSGALLVEALKIVPFGVVILDGDLRYVYANAVAARLNGFPEEDHLGRLASDVVPGIMAITGPVYQQVFATGMPVEGMEIEGETPSHPGELRWWATSYYPIKGEDDKGVVAVVGIFNDVTQARSARESREATEERFASFMTNLPGGAWVKDMDGRYVFSNSAAHRMFGLSLGEMEGKTDSELFEPALVQRFAESDKAALSAGRAVAGTGQIKSNGVDHYTMFSKFPISDAAGKRYIGGISVDITDRIRMEHALEENSQRLERITRDLEAANNAKDDFLGMVSHELRTPITTIMGNASVLLRRNKELGANERLASLSDLSAEAIRLNQIVENLLVLARLDRQELEIEPFRMSRSVRRVLREVRKVAPQSSIKFECASDEPIALGVEAYIDQVIRNYLSNTRKYASENGRVLVRLTHNEDEVQVRVLDRGVGLAEDDLEYLFQPFFRSTLVSEKTSGIGIGLTVCSRLIEAQKGRVWAKPREGGGAEFGFALPALGATESD